MISLRCGIKQEIIQINLRNRKRLTDLENELKVYGGKDGERDCQGICDGHVHIAIFKMYNQQESTVQHMELCSVLCGNLDGRGRMEACIRMAESLHCSHETLTTLVIGYSPIQPQPWSSQVVLEVNSPPANAGETRDSGSIPGSGRSHGV